MNETKPFLTVLNLVDFLNKRIELLKSKKQKVLTNQKVGQYKNHYSFVLRELIIFL